MELQFPHFILIFSLLLFLFKVAKILQQSLATKSTSQKLLPGPWRLPLIGNLHRLVASLPHHSLRDLAKKHGPLMHLKLGEISTIVVSSQEIAKEVLKTHDLVFAQRPLLVSAKFTSYDYTNIGLAPYGSYWRQLRRICTVELLSTKRVQSFRSIREEEVSNFIKTVRSNEGSVINLSEKIFTMTFGITARAAFGKKCKDQEVFISVVKEFIKIMSGFSISDLYPSIKLLQEISGVRQKLEKLHLESDRIFGEILDEHKEKRTKTAQAEAEEDPIDVFMNLQQNGDLEFPLTDNNIKVVIWVSMFITFQKKM